MVSRIILILLLFFTGLKGMASEAPTGRFFMMGDGVLVVSGQRIQYRDPANQYLEEGLKKINRLFGAPLSPPYERLSLRFVEILDFLQDTLKGGSYQIRSGYRSPSANQNLRDQGKLAAQSSMHVEGAAGDLILSGVPSSQVYDFVKALDCCGIGWYHGRHFHLDTGPSRYWDERTSKTEDKTPQQNEKIILQADWDRFFPGDSIPLKLMRITEYPIGIPENFNLIRLEGGQAPQSLAVQFPNGVETVHSCGIVQNRDQGRQIAVTLPETGMAPGKYSLEIKFCNRYGREKMPETIMSRPFEILAKGKD